MGDDLDFIPWSPSSMPNPPNPHPPPTLHTFATSLPAGRHGPTLSGTVDNLDRLFLGEALSLFGSRKHRNFSGESTPQVSSIICRAAPQWLPIISSVLEVHVEMLDQAYQRQLPGKIGAGTRFNSSAS